MTDTKGKLLAAKYFLGQMPKNQSERDAFKYNLSAFLAEARSVTLVMQSEFNKVPGFKQWYHDKQTGMQDDSEMRLLNEKRRQTIHQMPVSPSAHVNITVSDSIHISDSVSVVITHADGTVEQRGQNPEPRRERKPLKNESTTEWRWYFEELPDKDVVTICREHIGKLELLIEECESKFFL